MRTLSGNSDDGGAADLPHVSFESFANDLNRGPKASLLKSLKRARSLALPNFSDLRLGDVILTRRKRASLVSKAIIGRQRAVGFPEDHTKWTHSMIYVGQMHVAESVFAWYDIGRKVLLRSGTRIVPITKALHGCDYTILRHEKLWGDDFASARLMAANYALIDCISDRRMYNGLRIAELATDKWIRKAVAKINIPAIKSSIICSEFVLECFAIGTGIFAEKYFDLQQNIDGKYFYPASFLGLDGMTEVSLGRVNVTWA